MHDGRKVCAYRLRSRFTELKPVCCDRLLPLALFLATVYSSSCTPMNTSPDQNRTEARPVFAGSQRQPRADDRDACMRPRTNDNRQRTSMFPNSSATPDASASALPRDRSYWGSDPVTAAARAARNVYVNASTVSLFQENNSVVACAEEEAEDNGDERRLVSDERIYITVDQDGVKIEGQSDPSSPKLGREGVSISESRMTSISYRAGRPREIEDASRESNERAVESACDSLSSHNRGTFEGRNPTRKICSLHRTTGSWDGSMPNRQGSCSWYELQSRPNAE